VHSLCVFFIFRAKELPQEKFFIPARGEGITRKGKILLLFSRRCSYSARDEILKEVCFGKVNNRDRKPRMTSKRENKMFFQQDTVSVLKRIATRHM